MNKEPKGEQRITNVILMFNRKQYEHDYYLKNRDKFRNSSKRWDEQNREKRRKVNNDYYNRNKEKLRLGYKNFYEKNKSYINEKRRVYEKNRMRNDTQYKLRYWVRRQLGRYIKNKKSYSSIEYLGCTVNELKHYLESTVSFKFNWKTDWGFYKYHIDHIKPLYLFDLTKEEQIRQVMHYTNLRLLHCRKNWSKNKYEECYDNRAHI